MSSAPRRDPKSSQLDPTVAPTKLLKGAMVVVKAYSNLISESALAPVLGRASPVRREGFEMDLRVESVFPEADGVVSLHLVDPAAGELPAWTPGAHLDVFLPSGIQRQYSLSGDPTDRRRYRISVRRVENGAGSAEVHNDVRAGSTLHIRGPRNAYPFVVSDHILFVAGGIGITPILPMLARAVASGATCRLVYTGRSRASMPFLDEIDAIATDPGNTGKVEVSILPDDEVGITPIETILEGLVPGSAVFLCGPAPLIDAAHKVLPTVDPTASLHTERFAPPPIVGGEEFEITMARSGSSVTVGAEESALTALLRQRRDITYSCRQGFCGTCRVKVVSGEIEHNDHRLLDSERADTMLVCVSRGSSLVVDL